MLFLVVALLLLAFVVGSAAYLPLPVTLVASVVIAAWLAVFAVRERRRRGRPGRA
jgi:membrane protein implicated in regulation of membrane protease activity